MSAVLGVFYSVKMADILTSQAEESLGQVARNAAIYLDGSIRDMDRLSIKVAHSPLIRSTFLEYEKAPDNVSRYKLKTEIISQINYLIGPEHPVSQVNLYTRNNRSTGGGYYNMLRDEPASTKPWYDDAVNAKGDRILSLPIQNIWLRVPETTISLVRAYYSQESEWIGFIEVEQLMGVIFEYFAHAITEIEQVAAWSVIDSSDRLIYSEGPDINKDVEKNLISVSYQAPYSGFILTVSGLRQEVMRPLRIYWVEMGFIWTFLAILSALVSFILSRRIARPIGALNRQITDADFSIPSQEGRLESGITELESLNKAFGAMKGRWQKSASDLVEAQKHESEARLQALQAKMNPHFMYNTLTNIGIMSQEGRSADAARACFDLTDMLRYIARDGSDLVPLEEEFLHLDRYLDLMRIRYEEDLEITQELDSNLHDILVPRLTLQPLAENVFKHGLAASPPWKLTLHSQRNTEGWKITITDEGPGFPPHILTPPHVLCHNPDQLPKRQGHGGREQQTSGLGLRGTIVRLKYLFGDQTLFRLERGAQGGAQIVLGVKGELPS